MVDMKSFWKHSIGCGIAARILSGHTGITNRERLFVGGLIHDIGRLVLFMYHPVPASETLYVARESNRLLYDAENEVMTLRHTIVGKLLLKKWKLPITMENMVTYHHNPNSSKNPLEPSIIHLADVIVNALQIGTSGERLVPRLVPEAWQESGLSKSIIVPTIQQIERQLNEVIRFFIND
jgi:HD-like signal output (HDOD) protein